MNLRPILAISVALSLAATLPVHADEKSVWRLFVADHTNPEIAVIDLATGEILSEFTIASPARVYVGSSGEFAYAVQADTGNVIAIATGLEFEDHGDHADMDAGAPALVGDILKGDRPIHFVPHGDEIAVFFDGDGTAQIFSESMVASDGLETANYTSARPHHGVASTFAGHVLISEPVKDSDTSLPDRIRVLETDGTAVGEPHACTGLRGEAASGRLMAFACADGVLVFAKGSDGPESKFLPYPESFPEGRSGTLNGVKAFEMFVGNYGPEALILVDPSVSEPYRRVELPGPHIGFTLDHARVKYAYAVGFDGNLREIDLISGTISRTLKVTGPYSPEADYTTARPALAVAGGEIVVSDPDAKLFHLVSAEDFSMIRSIDTAGVPYSIAVAGGALSDH